jgi:dTDP-4-dehydrorhamnose reductase
MNRVGEADAHDERRDPSMLIVGESGQLGGALVRHRPSARAPARRDFDVARPGLKPSRISSGGAVFNCAAYVNVDACEAEGAEEAWRVNAFGPGNVARACAEAGATLVHFSTNYVFAGDRAEPYGEDDLPGPRSVYGITKLAGEYAALAYCPDTLVIRTAGLYGLGGNRSKGGNFVERILRAARDRGALKVVADQTLSPTFCGDLAAATLDAVERGARGLVHLTNAGSCSWHAFTVEILRLAGLENVPVEPVTTVPRPGVAHRPANGVLARPRADALGLPPMRPWQDALVDYMGQAGLLAR